MIKNDLRIIIDHFFFLKDWEFEGKEYWEEFRRYCREAKNLYEVCGEDVDKARKVLFALADWADKECLEWSIETAIKRWWQFESLTA